MSHTHSHDHDHDHDHAQSAASQGNVKRLRWVLILTLSYALIQAAGGWFAGSLALIADSAHMLTDSMALLLALVAYKIAERKPDAKRSYGFERVRVIAALANGALLIALTVWIVIEAVERAFTPIPVLATPMLVVAAIGLLVNIVGAVILHSGHQDDGNLRGAFLHVLGDLLGSVGAIAAAIGIMFTGWMWLDPLLSVLVSLLVLQAAWRLVSDALQVLIQATPKGLDQARIIEHIQNLEGVAQAGHLHAWTLTDRTIIATVHVSAQTGTDPLLLPARVGEYLRQQHGISHITVQVDPPGQLHEH